MFDRLRSNSTDPPGFDPEAVSESPQNTTVRTDTGRYICHGIRSPDERWLFAYGIQPNREGSKVFRIQADEVTFSTTANRPSSGSIANDGTFGVVDHVDEATAPRRLRVFTDRTKTVEGTRQSAISDVVVRRDGEVVVVATRQPDASVYALDAETGEEIWKFVPHRETPRLLGYHGESDLLYVMREPRKEPYIALGSDGEVVWGNERYRSKQSLKERLTNWIHSH